MSKTNGKAGPTPVTVATLHVENVKAVKAVHMELSPHGLTVIGGRNRQGKTSVLDAIAWTLGGGKFEPTKAHRNGAMNPPFTSMTLSNGIVVERRGKNSTLSVIDPSGAKGGQTLLNAFISQFALDLPEFLNANDKEKAQTLLKILGIGDKLAELDRQEETLYHSRLAIGQESTAKTKYAEELPEYGDAPDEPISAAELIQQQQAILARNGENERKRSQLGQILAQREQLQTAVARYREQLAETEAKLAQVQADYTEAQKSTMQLADESTAELQASLANVESINAQVRANLEKQRAADEATEYQTRYNEKNAEIEAVRAERLALLEGADLPLPGLTVEGGILLFNGQPWDGMATSEQLRVAVAIVRRLNPACGFVLMDKMESLDLDTMREFATWLEGEGLQVIATRVSTGAECSIIIEDGLPQGVSYAEAVTPIPAAEPVGNATTSWKDF